MDLLSTLLDRVYISLRIILFILSAQKFLSLLRSCRLFRCILNMCSSFANAVRNKLYWGAVTASALDEAVGILVERAPACLSSCLRILSGYFPSPCREQRSCWTGAGDQLTVMPWINHRLRCLVLNGGIRNRTLCCPVLRQFFM